MHLRELEIDDFEKGFLDCLKELTEVGDISKEAFIKRYNLLKYKDTHIVVALDNDVVIGTGAVFLEHKFIRKLGIKAHIEDIVVKKHYRGKNIGRKIIEYLVNYAKDKNVYKTVLSCNTSNVEFYEKCGFTKKEVEMVIYHENQ